ETCHTLKIPLDFTIDGFVPGQNTLTFVVSNYAGQEDNEYLGALGILVMFDEAVVATISGERSMEVLIDLQAAIEGTGDGETLELPEGVYEITQSLLIPNDKIITIRGLGEGATIEQTGTLQRVMQVGTSITGCTN